MKLRNKRTGDVDDFYIEDDINVDTGEHWVSVIRAHKHSGMTNSWHFRTLKELYGSFEDYEPKEPRIEDEKVRKIVEQWLMISLDSHMNIFFDKFMNGFYLYEENSDRSVAGITFPDNIKFNFEHDKDYTFAELCGEEE